MEIARQTLLDLVNRHPWWYHRMNLGEGVWTPGQYGDNLLPVASLIPHLNLAGASCLDIGTMDGKMAFLLEKLGGKVVTADLFERRTVMDLIDLFSSSVTYVTGIRDSNLTLLPDRFGHFDFVLCAGVLYHVFSPFDLIANVRRVIKNGGYALFESACLSNDRSSHMQLNWGDYYSEHTSIWIPTTACLKKMIRYFGFEIVGEAILRGKVPRFAVLCRADAPSAVGARTDDPWLTALLTKSTPGISSDYLLPQLDVEVFNAAPTSLMAKVEPVARRRVLGRLGIRGRAAEVALLERATPCPSL